jgi:hypothetical protein
VRTAALEIDQAVLYRLATTASASRWQTAFAEIHWAEEQVHQTFFMNLTEAVYHMLDSRGRELFVAELVQAGWDLAAFDRHGWLAILKNAGVDPGTARALVDASTPQPALASGVVRVLDALGIQPDVARGKSAAAV